MNLAFKDILIKVVSKPAFSWQCQLYYWKISLEL